MNKELAVVPTISDIERMGQAIAKSGLFGVKTPEQAVALMLIAQAEGHHPAIAARDYHIIQGRPALKADAMLARFQAAGGSVKWTQYTDKVVSAVFTHPQGGSVTITWTIEQAAAAGLTKKDTWRQYPRQMLRARVISEGIRTVFPGCVVGTYTPEEIQDFEPVRTAAPQVPPADIDGATGEVITPKDSTPTPEGPAAPPRLITDKQRRRMFAIAHGAGWKDDEIKEYLMKEHGVEHSDKVRVEDYNQIVEHLAGGAPVPEDGYYQGELEGDEV